MAHNDDIDKIRYESTLERVKAYKIIECDGVKRFARETPMEFLWPSGDPVPRDRETLVEWISREAYEDAINEEVKHD